MSEKVAGFKMSEKSQSREVRFFDSRGPAMKTLFGEGTQEKCCKVMTSLSGLFHFPYAPPINQHGKTGWLLSYFLGEVPFNKSTSDKPRRYGGVS
jgi:hypothetical protein